AGMLAALPATVGAAYWFQTTVRQSQWEAALAAATLGLAIWFMRRIGQGIKDSNAGAGTDRGQAYRLAVMSGTALVVTRQSMEIAVALEAAVQLRAPEPLSAIAAGLAIAVGVSALWL